jgi:type VI secretion system protein ImpH
MSATHCREDTSVIQRLLDEPQRFEFCQAVRVAIQWLGEHGVAPDAALAGYLCFQNSLSLGFPASEVEALRAVSGGRLREEAALAAALHGREPLQIQITPSFMGFLGAHGALPLHETERIQAWQSAQHDESPRAFLDMLSNRMLALFYEAWRKYRVEQGILGGKDAFLPLLLALAGYDQGAGRGKGAAVDDEAIALYAGILQQRPLSSVALARILASFFEVPVRLEDAVGHWNQLAAHEQACLGCGNATLGEDTMLGERSWRPDLRARLLVGPLDREQFDHFLPNAPGAALLRKMLALFADQTVCYEVALVLRADEVRPVRLPGSPGGESRLGLDSFLMTSPVQADRMDLRYDVRPMGPLPPRRGRSAAAMHD